MYPVVPKDFLPDCYGLSFVSCPGFLENFLDDSVVRILNPLIVLLHFIVIQCNIEYHKVLYNFFYMS